MVTSILHLNRKCITFYTKAQKIIGLLTQKKNTRKIAARTQIQMMKKIRARFEFDREKRIKQH